MTHLRSTPPMWAILNASARRFARSWRDKARRTSKAGLTAMPLTPGATLGPCVIRSLLGSGGMGEVYLAHDTRLDRHVALKLLPVELANDAERLRRFECTLHPFEIHLAAGAGGAIVAGSQCSSALPFTNRQVSNHDV